MASISGRGTMPGVAASMVRPRMVAWRLLAAGRLLVVGLLRLWLRHRRQRRCVRPSGILRRCAGSTRTTFADPSDGRFLPPLARRQPVVRHGRADARRGFCEHAPAGAGTGTDPHLAGSPLPAGRPAGRADQEHPLRPGRPDPGRRRLRRDRAGQPQCRGTVQHSMRDKPESRALCSD